MTESHPSRHAREEHHALRDSDRLERREGRRRDRADRRFQQRQGLGERSGRTVKPAEERRRDVLEAALGLFASKGFAETTVSDIADEAHMGTGTVYLYFPSKEHVLLGLHERFAEELDAHVATSAVDAIERAGSGENVDYRETVDAIIDAVAGHFAANRDLAMVCTKYRPELVAPDYNPAHLGIVARALHEGVRMGFIHTSDPDMTAYLFDAAIAFNLHMHIAYNDPPDLDRFVAAAKEMVHKSLALTDGAAEPKPRPSASVSKGKGGPKGRGSPSGRTPR